jgi:tetratricopeptide (TPR) repeat protein
VGFRARRSIKLAPGVRLNVSKRGIGASVGAGGVRYSVHSSGRRTVSARTGIPGVYYQQSATSRRTAGTHPTPSTYERQSPKPGFFAPKGEKQLYRAIKAQSLVQLTRVGQEQPNYALIANSIAGLTLFCNHEDSATEAKRLLSDAFATGQDPAEQPFARKYLATQISFEIADSVSVELPVNRDAVGLALAELYQDEGDLQAAINVVEQLEPTTYAAVSLAELYAHVGRHHDVVDLTENTKNEDDASALLCTYRGIAFRELGYHDAAQEAFKEALRYRSRSEPIRHKALFERARNYEAQGKKAMARKDLERILADDSSYETIRQKLDELASH